MCKARLLTNKRMLATRDPLINQLVEVQEFPHNPTKQYIRYSRRDVSVSERQASIATSLFVNLKQQYSTSVEVIRVATVYTSSSFNLTNCDFHF